MKREEILKKAIEKAHKNGWNWEFVKMTDTGIEVTDGLISVSTGVSDIIFSHNFAKAFWGEGMSDFRREPLHEHYRGMGRVVRLYDWQFHLQQMVLEEDPIKYLEQFI